VSEQFVGGNGNASTTGPREQFLLVKLAEECQEVAQRALKQAQYGAQEAQEGNPTNSERLRDEVLDFSVILNLLYESGEIRSWSSSEFKKAKAAKLVKMGKSLAYSQSLGLISKEVEL